jgi:hypothetical protein
MSNNETEKPINLFYNSNYINELKGKGYVADAVINTMFDWAIYALEMDVILLKDNHIANKKEWEHNKDINEFKELKSLLEEDIDMILYVHNFINREDDIKLYTGLQHYTNNLFHFLYIPIYEDVFDRSSIEQNNSREYFGKFPNTEDQLESIVRLYDKINEKCKITGINTLPEELKSYNMKNKIQEYCKENGYQGLLLVDRLDTIFTKRDLENEVVRSYKIAKTFNGW